MVKKKVYCYVAASVATFREATCGESHVTVNQVNRTVATLLIASVQTQPAPAAPGTCTSRTVTQGRVSQYRLDFHVFASYGL